MKLSIGVASVFICSACGSSEPYIQREVDQLEANERNLDSQLDKAEADLKKLRAEEQKYLNEFPPCPHDIPPYKPAYDNDNNKKE